MTLPLSTTIGSNKHGFKNEVLIANYLNKKKYSELNLNFKEFIKFIATENDIRISNDTLIKSWPTNNSRKKEDLAIEFLDHKFYISLKMGSGNSIHQQKIEDFVDYLKKTLNAEDSILDDFRFFIWADGTLDGTAPKNFKDGKVEGRFGSTQFKNLYPDKRDMLQKFVNLHSSELLEYVLFIGKNNSIVDYIYHGNLDQGKWASKKQIIDFNELNKDTKDNKALSLCRASIQSWNPSLNGSDASEKKRGEIQVKYGLMKQDLNNIMLANAVNHGTLWGDSSEYDLVKTLNKNKKHKFWKLFQDELGLGPNLDSYFAVKVSSKAMSSVSGKIVYPKSDAYLIHANVSRDILLQNEYELDENNLRAIGDYIIVDSSGISIKREDSSKYTITKMTVSTFCAFFKQYEYAKELATCLLLYQEEKKIHINKKIMSSIGVDKNSLEEYIKTELGIQAENINNTETLKSINTLAIKKTKDIIENDSELKIALFTGKNVFAPPYYIEFTYKNSLLSKYLAPEYSITTGSGRSKGTYTIVIKPKN